MTAAPPPYPPSPLIAVAIEKRHEQLTLSLHISYCAYSVLFCCCRWCSAASHGQLAHIRVRNGDALNNFWPKLSQLNLIGWRATAEKKKMKWNSLSFPQSLQIFSTRSVYSTGYGRFAVQILWCPARILISFGLYKHRENRESTRFNGCGTHMCVLCGISWFDLFFPLFSPATRSSSFLFASWLPLTHRYAGIWV